eukprot:gene8417-9902_t
MERNKRAKHIVLPTNDALIKAKLRELGEPIILFGEKPEDRRNRLRNLCIDRNITDGVPIAERKKLEVVESVHDEQEAFLTEGTEELKNARIQIALWSTAAAKKRLDAARLEHEAEKPVLEANERNSDPNAWQKTPRQVLLEETEESFKTFSMSVSEMADERPVSSALFSPDGLLVATTSWSGYAKLWSIDGSHKLTYTGHTQTITGAAFHPGASASPSTVCLATASRDNTALLWSLESPAPIGKLEGHTDAVNRVAFHPGGRHVATTSADRSWRLWDVSTGTALLDQEGHSESVMGIAFQCDGSLVATGGVDSLVRVWDMRSGRSIQYFKGHVKQVISIDWSPNGYQLASASEDNSVMVWDIRKRERVYQILAHSSIVSCVRYQKNGVGCLATASFDNTVRLWSPLEWKPIVKLEGHSAKTSESSGVVDPWAQSLRMFYFNSGNRGVNQPANTAQHQQRQPTPPAAKKNGYVKAGIVVVLLCLFFYPLVFKVIFKEDFLRISSVEVNAVHGGLKKIAGWNLRANRQVVNAVDLMNALNIASPTSNEAPADIIKSTDDFANTFAHYFKMGSAAERFIESKEVFDQVISAAMALEKKSMHTGGNAGIIANRMAREGCKVSVGGVVGKSLKSLLNDSIQVVPVNENQEVAEDEVHLIMEYSSNSTWGSAATPRANRFIVSRDLSNAGMVAIESFHAHIAKEQPQLVVLSGLHLLPEDSANQRIDAMMAKIGELPFTAGSDLISADNVPIHLELASMASMALMKKIARDVLPFVDSIGLNEQELGFLYAAMGGQAIPASAFKAPTPDTAVSALVYVFERANEHIEQATKGAALGADDKRVLTRIHFHFLTYHIVAARSDSAWTSRAAIAVAASSIEASDMACGMKDVELRLPLKFEVEYQYTPGTKLKLKLDETSPVASWSDAGLAFNLAPVLVCKVPLKTVGLGDSISTMGLLYQTFSTVQ